MNLHTGSTRVGIFGGSFNPPHQGHMAVAAQAVDRAGLDSLCLVPAARPPHKRDEILASFAHRLSMVSLLAAKDARFCVSDVEGTREGPSYTVDTVQSMGAQAGPNAALYLVVGGDSLLELGTWYEVETLLSQVHLVVAPRPGALFDLATIRPEGLSEAALSALRRSTVLDTNVEVSASEIRGRVAHGLSLAGLVIPSVAAYIEEHGLYRARP